MDRRSFLVGAAAVVAGCAGSSGAPGTASTPTATRTESTTSTATATRTATQPQTAAPAATTAGEPTENPYRPPTPIGPPAPNGLALVGVHPTERQRPFISGEYVTLENTADAPLDLSGYTLTYHSGGQDRRLHTFSLTLEPGARVYVLTRTGKPTTLASSPPGYLRFAGYEKPILDDSRGVITITDANGDGVLKREYGDDTTPGPTDETPPSKLIESGSGEYPHAIVVTNRLDPAKSITVTVKRQGNVLYRETHEVGTGRTVVAGFTERTVTERSVHVTFSLPNGSTETVDFVIDDCHGNVFATIDDSGDLQTTYGVC